MFVLVIKKNRSKNFSKAVDCALMLGGTFNGKEIRIEIDEDLHIYNEIFPILKYNVTNWAGTTAFFNGKQVHPYKFMLAKHLSIRAVMTALTLKIKASKPVSRHYIYHKREKNVFYFKNDDFSFDVELTGKDLYEFLEEYDVGDELYFENMDGFYV